MNDKPSNTPSWYWSRGLYDARVLSVLRLELSAYQNTVPIANNCLAVYLNSNQAVAEKDVAKIAFYNYQIEKDLDFLVEGELWWLWDHLSMEEGRYRLEVTFADENHARKQFTVTFDRAEVVRNDPQ